MYFVHIPKVVQKLFPGFVWRIEDAEQTVYLTFDDGPSQHTPWILDLLDRWNAKATFFCVGRQVERYPHYVEEIRKRGHAIGNHSYSHPSGWTTDDTSYLMDVKRAQQLLQTNLFRPPYGKLKPRQAQYLLRHYKIIMWDVMSGDFDPHVDADQCAKNVLDHAKSGSIIVFHDSPKAWSNLSAALPLVLQSLHERQMAMEAIPGAVPQTYAQPSYTPSLKIAL